MSLSTATTTTSTTEQPQLRTHALSVVESIESMPSRCESPLLPMGQSTRYQTDPNRLSDQLGKVRSRFSQHSILNKNYAIHDDEELASPPPDKRKHKVLTRAKSYKIAAAEAGRVREFSSKLKSACRKLNPKRRARNAHGEPSETPSEPRKSDTFPMPMSNLSL
ncbi:hypothetical protein EC988_007060 [Linderina pennispora]|nr:hypothetical protein EC988_007060 [Linderina pennispora]